MFTRLAVQNFRAIGPGRLEIELAPLTVLVGPSGGGKSSVLQALLLTAQSALEEERLRDLVLTGDRVDLPVPATNDLRAKYRSIYFEHDDTHPLSVGIDAAMDLGRWVSVGMPPARPPALSWIEPWPPVSVGYEWTRSDDGSVWSHAFRAGGAEIVRLSTGRMADAGQPPSSVQLFTLCRPLVPWVQPCSLNLERVLSEDLLRRGSGQVLRLPPGSPAPPADFEAAWDIVLAISRLFRNELGGVAPLSALRGTEMMHTDVGPDVTFVGKFGEQAVRLLSNIQTSMNPRFALLRHWAEQFGLKGVVPGYAGGNQLKVAFRDPFTETPLDLSEAASGSKQGLLLAAHLLLSQPGSTLLIEEPENDMHPKFEHVLAGLLAESVKSEHQVILSTHSEVLVAALANAVRDQRLRPDQLSVVHMERGTSGCQGTRIQVSDRGYLDEWVRSFAEVEERLFAEWSKGLPEEGPAPGR